MAISGKVAGGVGGVGIAGSLTIIGTWIVKLKYGLDIPDTVGDAITLLLSAIGAGVGAWLIPHGISSDDSPALQDILQAISNMKENGQQSAAQV